MFKNQIFPYLFFLFGTVVCLPLSVSAAVGDNCQVNLTSGISDTQNWKNVYIVRGDDGSAWQRGIISNPQGGKLLISEGESTNITATVAPNADTAFFVYTNEGNGFLKKPGEGVCFEGLQGSASGSTTFPINARALWGAIGKRVVVDVFYRMDQSWSQVTGQNTNNNFLIGTSLPPKIVTVNLDVPPVSKVAMPQIQQGAWERSGGSGATLPTQPGAISGGSQSGLQQPAPSEMGQPRVEISPPSSKIGGGSNQQSGCLSGGSAFRVDPANFPPRFLGNNFDKIGGNAVDISILVTGTNTHYVRLANTNSENANASEMKIVAHKIEILEGIKRMLEGAVNKPLFGSSTRANAIGNLMPDNLQKNAETNATVKGIKTLLTGSGDRKAAATTINKIFRDWVGSQGFGFIELQPEYLLDIFPTISTADTWAEDFLNILVAWTGSTAQNLCIFSDLMSPDLSEDLSYFSTAEGSLGNGVYANGVSPRILLNTTDTIALSPAFSDTKIVYAEKQFTDAAGWALSAGKKQPLYYRYDFTSKFSKTRVGEMCIKQAMLPKLISSLNNAYHLTDDEAATLSAELTAEFPETDDFVQLSLANPTDIATRFSWTGNGEPLSLLQLFFEFTPGDCTEESLTPPTINLPMNRDGFETGIIE